MPNLSDLTDGPPILAAGPFIEWSHAPYNGNRELLLTIKVRHALSGQQVSVDLPSGQRSCLTIVLHFTATVWEVEEAIALATGYCAHIVDPDPSSLLNHVWALCHRHNASHVSVVFTGIATTFRI